MHCLQKALIAELQSNVQVLTEENKQLKAITEAIQYELQTVVLENQRLRMICAQSMPQALAVMQQPTAAPGNSTLPAPTAISNHPVSAIATQAPAVDTAASAAPVMNEQQPSNLCANTSTGTSGISTPNAQLTLPNAGTIPLDVVNQGLMSMFGTGNMLPFQMMQAMVANGMLPAPQVAGTLPTAPPQVNPTTMQTNPTLTAQGIMNGMPPVAPLLASGAMMTGATLPPTTQTAGVPPQAGVVAASVPQANPFSSLQEDQGGENQYNGT